MKFVLTVLSLLFSLVAFFWDDWLEHTMALCFILSLGMIHGANDILLYKQLTAKTQRSFSNLKSNALYLAIICLMLALFFLAPVIALATFILFSAFHFGEQHFNRSIRAQGLYSYIYPLCYGMVIFFLLFCCRTKETLQNINTITGVHIEGPLLFFLFLFFFILWLVLSMVGQYTKNLNINILWELLLLGVLGFVFHYNTTLWGFTIYFILWHSIPSLLDQLTFLYGDISFTSLYHYVKSAAWYWLACIALVAFFKLFHLRFDDTLLVILGASVTIPHILVIFNVNRASKRAS